MGVTRRPFSLDHPVGGRDQRCQGEFLRRGNASCQEPTEGVTVVRGSHQIRVRIGSSEGNSAPEAVSSAADFTSSWHFV